MLKIILRDKRRIIHQMKRDLLTLTIVPNEFLLSFPCLLPTTVTQCQEYQKQETKTTD